MRELVEKTLHHISTETGGDLTVISISPDSVLMGQKFDLLAQVRIGKEEEGLGIYDCHLVFEEISGRSNVRQKVGQLRDAIDQLKSRFSKDNKTDLRVYGVLVTHLDTDKMLNKRTAHLNFINARTGEVVLRLPRFYFTRLSTLDQGALPTVSRMSLRNIIEGKGHQTKAVSGLTALLTASPSHAWSAKELAEKSSMSIAAAWKLKHRLLHLGVVTTMSDSKTRFQLTEQGKKTLKELNL